MKITLICGSQREPSNTKSALEVIANELSKEHKVNFISLKNYKIEKCNGCLFCEKKGKCVFKDDMDELNANLLLSDLIIIGGPVYFSNVPGLLKDFIDRTVVLYWEKKLNGKFGASVVIEGEEAGLLTQQALQEFYRYHEITFLGGIVIRAYYPRDFLKDKKQVNRVKDFANEINKKLKELKK